jgi:hypothetical protein
MYLGLEERQASMQIDWQARPTQADKRQESPDLLTGMQIRLVDEQIA